MTTRRLALALVASLALAVAACGGDDDDDSATAGESAEETTTTAAEAEEAPTADAGEAAGEAVSTVFDSAVAFDDKVALIQDGASYQSAHDGYVAAAQAVGGITVEPTDVAPAGDTATVTYRVLFGGNEAYSGLTMGVTKVEDDWIVPTEEFCGFLQSARVTCTPG